MTLGAPHPCLSLKKTPCFGFYVCSLKFYLFIFGCAGSWLLCRLFSSCGEQGPRLLAVAPPVAERGL